MSTTPLKHVTRANAKDWGSDVIFKIKVHKGTGKGAYIKKYSDYPEENELLLKPKTKFKIVKYIDSQGGDIPTLLMEEMV